MIFKRRKYGSKKVEYEGVVFDSKLELSRWVFLQNEEKNGRITNLRRQVKFTLIPAAFEEVPRYGKRGNELKPKEICVERECCYVADFVYNVGEKEIVSDSKGMETPDFIIKRKLMRHIGHPIYIIKKATDPVC